mmetsp:Transcript_9458/g.14594  ORF Transcript_9458/g.14594 Transcript_9458/m.14594 type:complete len:371 (-) Transcript_9458:89-1201(-)
MIVLPQGSATNYYGKNALVWNVFQLAAVLYTVLSNLASFCMKPIPFLNRALPVVNEPPFYVVSSKVAIVTGSNTGIGFETSLALVERGFEVVMACRSEDKALKAIQLIRREYPNGPGKAVFHAPLDLSDIKSVNAFSTKINDYYDKVDLLINNAGRIYGGEIANGWDEMFLTNYLGHFLLTKNLIDRLVAAENPRVVNVSSVMHHFSRSNAHDISYWNKFARFGRRCGESSYSPTKLAALYFTLELNRRYQSQGLRAIAVNPGAVNSDIWREMPRYLIPIFRLLYLNSKQGSYTTVAASMLKNLPKDVIYLQPYHQINPKVEPWPPTEMLGMFVGYLATKPRLPNDGTGGELSAQALWEISDQLVKDWGN